MRLLNQAAGARSIDFQDAARRLADGIDGTANNLFGAFFEMLAGKGLSQRNRRSAATQVLESRAANRPTLREIVAVVARHQKVPQTQLKSGLRRQSMVFARDTRRVPGA